MIKSLKSFSDNIASEKPSWTTKKKKKSNINKKVVLCSDKHPCMSFRGQRQKDCPQVPAQPGKSLINNNYKLVGGRV